MSAFKDLSDYKIAEDINVNADTPQLKQGMNIKTGNFVAIKYFPEKLTRKLSNNFETEIGLTFAAFNPYSLRHKHLIHIHEARMSGAAAFLVMDWCDGKSLYDIIHGYQTIPEKLLARYIYEVLQGLDYLHSQGNRHDNIKASNILRKLSENGAANLTDFGLAAKISNLDLKNHPYWSAPEVLESTLFSKESDIWSLGCTIIEVLTGNPPYFELSPQDARNHIISEEHPPFPLNISSHLYDFLTLCFKREPSQRPSARDLMTHLWITTNYDTTQEVHEEPQSAHLTKQISQMTLALNEKPQLEKSILEESTKNEEKYDLQDFEENSNSSYGEFLDDAHSSKLEIKSRVQPKADFKDFDQKDINDEEILRYLARIEELSRELVTSLLNLNRTDQLTQFNHWLKSISEILKEEKRLKHDFLKEPSIRSTLVSQQGILPIIEVIEFSKLKNEQNINLILSIIYDLVAGQSQIKENFCLLGGIPPLMTFLHPSQSADKRRAAVHILIEICYKSQDNMQMFIACNGLSAIHQVLKYDLETESDLIVQAVLMLSDYFNSQRNTTKADLCRLFMKAGIFHPMSRVLIYYSTTEHFQSNEETQKCVSIICDLFNTFSQMDTKVKFAISSIDVMENLIGTMYNQTNGVLRYLSLDDTNTLCKTIKNIAIDSETRDNLTDAGVMEMTCEMLKFDFDSGKTDTQQNMSMNLYIHSNLFIILTDMCKLSQVSKERVSIIADLRLLPYLVEYMSEEVLRPMALSVIMELYNVGKSDKKALKKLLDDNLVGIYLENLKVFYYGSKAITALSSLLKDDEAEIEPLILTEDAIQNFREGLKQVDDENARTFIAGYTAMAKKSKNFVNALINPEFLQILIEKFAVQKENHTFKAVPAALLEFILAMFQSGAPNLSILKTPEMKDIIMQFSNSDNVKQQTNATRILEFFK